MLILMELDWPWMALGVVLIWWGNGLIGFGWRDWVEFWLSWPMTLFSEDTTTEKKVLKEKRVEEEIAANPGCGLLLVGWVCLIFGLVRWLT